MNSSIMLLILALTRSDESAVLQPDFEFHDGDRVVFVGNTFIERDQVYGYLETMLTARWSDRNITFRNLGWSGDTVWGEARARFGTAEDGFQHLKEHVAAIKPTVIFVAYGANESFEGEAGLPNFEEGLNRLLDMFAAAASNPRVILLSPLQQADLGPPRPDPKQHNEDVRRYTSAIQKVAADRDCRFIDLFESGLNDLTASIFRHTDNGIHLTASGYWKEATVIMRELGIQGDVGEVTFGNDRRPIAPAGTQISNVVVGSNTVLYEMKRSTLPYPLPPPHQTVTIGFRERYSPLGLPAGNYLLTADGVEIKGSEKRQWSDERPYIRHSPDYKQVEQLRQAIIEKNRLYFHRWRPQNETYLFGFRKHEQGQNAAEVPRFDPLVEEMEAKIAELRVPVMHTFELLREEAPNIKHQIPNKSQ